MVRTGLRTSGVSWIGIVCSATRPNISTIRIAAITAIGLLMASLIRFMAGNGPPQSVSV